MILDTTNKSLQVELAGAVTTNQLSCVASWADMASSAFTPGSTSSQTNDTTAVTIVSSPASSVQRQVKGIEIFNADTADATIKVIYNDNSTLRNLVKISLQPNETLQFAENKWSVIDSAGRILSTATPSGNAGGDLTGTYPDPVVLKASQAFTTGVAALTDGSTISVDATLGNLFTLTLGGNHTLSNPTGSVNGQRVIFAVSQDSTGGRTLSYGSNYDFGTAGAPTLSAAASATDYLEFIYNSTASKWKLLEFVSAAGTSTSVTPTTPAWQFDITAPAYGAKGDGKAINDLSITSSSTTATSSSANFTSADTGKYILIAGGGGTNTPLSTTITYVNATTVTLGTAAGATLSSASAIYGTDDTAAINDAITAATSYAQAHNQYAEITGPIATYIVADDTTKTTVDSLHYNAQILLPGVTGVHQKVTLAFRFADSGIAPPVFGQSVPQAAAGATFVSMLTGQTVDGTYGVPSVIGGPTNGGNSDANTSITNICPVIDGLTVIVPQNPTVAGVDLRGCATASVPRLAVMAFATPAVMSANGPTHDWTAGLYMPVELNNDECFIGELNIYGFYFGVAIYSHTSAQTLKIIYCHNGIFTGGNGNDKHGLSVNYASVEGINTALVCDGAEGITIPVNFGMLDTEAINWYGSGGNHIYDPNNGLGGTILVNGNPDAGLNVVGGANVEVIAVYKPRGNVSAPTMPSSGTALTNPFWRHAWVLVSGGDVSNISIDGATTGLSSGTLAVPSGKTIAISYTVAPTWKWVLQ